MWGAYEDKFKEMRPKKPLQYITQQIDIRWGCKFEAIAFIVSHIDVVVSILIHVADRPEEFQSKTAETAASLYHKMASGKFVFGLATLHTYLSELYYLNKELQAEKIDWNDVQFELKRTKQEIDKISDEHLLSNTNKVCNDLLGISLCLNMPKHRTRGSVDSNA